MILKRIIYLPLLLILMATLILYNCSNGNDKPVEAVKIVQSTNGNISLSLKDAYLLFDNKNPKRNTAEWNFEVLNKGRYDVWLSSFTKDTMHLAYEKPVEVLFDDERIVTQPIGNQIYIDDNEAKQSYYRADSHMGSILIRDSGRYRLQIVSEKVLPIEQSESSRQSTIIDRIVLKSQAQ